MAHIDVSSFCQRKAWTDHHTDLKKYRSKKILATEITDCTNPEYNLFQIKQLILFQLFA